MKRKRQSELFELSEESAIDQGIPSTVVMTSDSSETAGTETTASEYEASESSDSPPQNNMLDVTKISAAAIRYGVSNRATAAISTATLAVAKDAGLCQDPPVIGVNKIKRSKDKLMLDMKEHGSKSIKESQVTGILFDGSKDTTKVFLKGDDNKFHPGEIKEEHYSICSEPGSEYLCHLTLDKDDRGDQKAAQQLANSIHEWICEHGIDTTLKAVGGDSTAVNTGYKGGAIHHLEMLLGRKVIWIICALHTNELPLRHLVIELDGKTTSNNQFSGPIGRLVNVACDLSITEEDIPDIGVDIDLIELEEEVVKDLSADQKYLYNITCAIRDGHIDVNLKRKKMGPHNHARWLNLASRLCRIWCSNHRLSTMNTLKLKKIVQFVVAVYVPMWFEIKVKNKLIDGPSHILTQLRLLRKLDDTIRDIVVPYIKSSAWNAHPEAILQAMLCSDDITARDFAVYRIMMIRGDDEYGDTSVRNFKIPNINMDATELQDLIEWSTEPVTEPLLTCALKDFELRDIIYSASNVFVHTFQMHPIPLLG